jgi:hypothetical protein
VVDAVAEDVQVVAVPVERGDLGRGDDAHAVLAAGGERLVDAVDRVVVGQREQLHPGGRRPGHDFGRGQRAVGVKRMRLQVERGR